MRLVCRRKEEKSLWLEHRAIIWIQDNEEHSGAGTYLAIWEDAVRAEI